MSDRFSDNNFIEAARVYQNIKAPSDLREKVLEGTAAPVRVQKTKRIPGKIYKLASLAACIAVMAAVLPSWILPDGAGGDVPSVPDMPQMVRMMPEPEEPDEAGEPAVASEPVIAAEPVISAEEPAGTEESSETEDFAPEEELKQEEEAAQEQPSISVGKLLPAMLAANTSLGEMEVRILSSEEGSCTVEVTTADHKTAEVTLSRNEEDGHWEFQEADEEVSTENLT